jgi:hypothetical protein
MRLASYIWMSGDMTLSAPVFPDLIVVGLPDTAIGLGGKVGTTVRAECHAAVSDLNFSPFLSVWGQ